jgi:hypothetical protein
MSKMKKKLANVFKLIIIVVIVILSWSYFYQLGLPSFVKANAVSIYGTIVQGMSALLSVSIAVIIFRIQSLENRLHSLEESTLNYIFQISQNTFPKWLPCLEENIRSGSITNEYFKVRMIQKNLYGSGRSEEDLRKDKENQQSRLLESLEENESVKQTIQKTRQGAYWSFFLLAVPIVMSFFFLLTTESIMEWSSFNLVSIAILVSILGIVSLAKTVVDSLVIK